jgi:hypothetical protein
MVTVVGADSIIAPIVIPAAILSGNPASVSYDSGSPIGAFGDNGQWYVKTILRPLIVKLP